MSKLRKILIKNKMLYNQGYALSLCMHVLALIIFFIFSHIHRTKLLHIDRSIRKNHSIKVRSLQTLLNKAHSEKLFINEVRIKKSKALLGKKANSLTKRKNPSNNHEKDYLKQKSSHKSSNIIPVIKNYKKQFINYVEPKYPRLALLDNQQGTVIVRILVDKSKIVNNVLYHTSGYFLLDRSVMNAVKSWHIIKPFNHLTWLEVKVRFIIK